jgi:hypothetical protein
MISKKAKTSWLFNDLLQKFKKLLQKLKRLSRKYPLLFQFLQLSFLYFYATITLMYSVINCIGVFPDFLYKIIPFTKLILSVPVFKILATPEKTFLLYLAAVEIVLNGKSTSLLVKYNFVLVFILEMIQNVLVSLWDLFSHRDMDILVGDIEFSQENAMAFFTIFFLIFYVIYLYCYLSSLMLKFVSFPHPFQKVTESVAFWLNIKKLKKEKKKE